MHSPILVQLYYTSQVLFEVFFMDSNKEFLAMLRHKRGCMIYKIF